MWITRVCRLHQNHSTRTVTAYTLWWGRVECMPTSFRLYVGIASMSSYYQVQIRVTDITAQSSKLEFISLTWTDPKAQQKEPGTRNYPVYLAEG
jgi:hypothetical protein